MLTTSRNKLPPFPTLILLSIVIVLQLILIVSWMNSNKRSLDEHHGLEFLSNRPPVTASTATQHANHTNSTLSQSTATVRIDDATCDELLTLIHERNHQYRTGDDSAAIIAPVYNYAYYKGQGFGRVIDHSVKTCLFALLLDRPCVVDVSDRDPYYTWRSFINVGTYDWEIRGRITQHESAVKDLIAQLPEKQEGGTWKQEQVKILPHNETIFPLVPPWPSGQKLSIWEGLKAWKDVPHHLVLLSPNWGLAWFSHLKFPKKRLGKCSMNELMSRLQNALYWPTPLAWQLHSTRKPKVLPQPELPYGSIHIRTVFMTMGREKKTIDLEKLHQNIQQCTTLFPHITQWWILSDKPHVAHNMTSRNKTWHDATHLPDFSFESVRTVHSNNDQAKAMYGHEHMAVSVMDWMVLWDSTVALVTEGSFGATGARGNNKVLTHKRQCSFYVYQ